MEIDPEFLHSTNDSLFIFFYFHECHNNIMIVGF